MINLPIHPEDKIHESSFLPQPRFMGFIRIPAIFLSGILFLLSAFASPNMNLACLNALESDTQPYQYCYKTTIKITNNGNTTLYNYPIRLTVPYESWFTSDYVDVSHSTSRDTSKAWDLKSFKSTLSNEVEIIGQDIRDMNTGEMQFWFIVPEIPVNDSSFTLLMGNNEQKRNQGIFFDGSSTNTASDTFIVNDNNALDVTTNYEITLDMKMFDETLFETATLLDKYDGVLGSGTGYAIKFTKLTTVPASMQVSCYSDGSVANTTYAYGSAVSTEVKMIHNGTGIQCSAGLNSSPVVSANPTNTNTKNLIIGDGVKKTMLYDLKFTSGNTVLASYGFDAFSLDETDPLCPYASVIQDYSGAFGTSGTYNTHSCQTNISASMGSVVLTSASDIPDIPTGYTGWSPTFFGDGNPFATPTANNNAFGSEYYSQPSGFGVPSNFWYSMLFTPIGLILGGLIFITSRSLLMAIIAAGLPVLFAISQGFLPVWFGIVWLLVVMIAAGIKQFGEQF
tara:strand:- start:1385 stop:2911 length:1527 start_codon:yes stop_codon:yes gene_type:complete